MKIKRILCMTLCVALVVGCCCLAACTPTDGGDDEGKGGTLLPVYSDMISEVRDIKLLTGPLSVKDTHSNWNVGCTDLGFPYYDATNNQMRFWFGDTFSSLNNSKEGWRSNVLGITSDFDASDGIEFDEFVCRLDGYAAELINSEHDTSKGSEYTCIPTGGFELNGVHYAFYMSINNWDNGWLCNFCNVAKSTDGENFVKMNNLFWCNSASVNSKAAGQVKARLGISDDAVITAHVAPNFMQIFPYVYEGYVYIFGLPSARLGGVKLGRVAVANFENFDEYEYYYDGQWYKGTAGLNKIKGEYDEKSFIVKPSVGEVCVSYNKYLDKFLMTYYISNSIVFRTSDNLTEWSKSEKIITNAEFLQLYGGFTHEKYMSNDGKTVYFFLSRWYKYDENGVNVPNDPEGYNVRVMSFTFK